MQDKHGNLVCLFPNEYRLNLAVKNYSELEFSAVNQHLPYKISKFSSK